MTTTTPQQSAGLDDLLARTGAPATARPRWWSAWSRAFDRPAELVELRRRGGGSPEGSSDLLGAAALTTARRAGGTAVTVVGGDTADHARLPAASARDARALADLVVARLGELPGRWSLRLPHLPPGDPAAQRLAEVLPGATWTLAPDRASPWVRLESGTEVGSYLGATSRKSRGRRDRKWARSGGTVRHVSDPDEVRALLPRLEQVRRARDHAASRVSDIDSPAGREFWSSVIVEHAAAGEAEVALAEIGEDLLAYDVVLLDGPAHRLWDGRIAPGAEQLGAGQLLQDVALGRALAAGADELDLLRGVTPAKMRLATDVRSSSVLEAWSAPWERTGELALRGATGWAKAARDSSSAATRAWRTVKGATVLHRASRGTGVASVEATAQTADTTTGKATGKAADEAADEGAR